MIDRNNARPDLYGPLKQYAREMRRNQTDAESALWNHIKNKQLGVSFLRQYIIDDYIVDFICRETNLIIEVDGEYHDYPEQVNYDNKRSERLIELGYTIIRFTNNEILFNLDTVLNTITKNISRSNTPLPSREGLGGSELAYQYAQYTRRNIFLTGKAGTGKTTFLRKLQQETNKRMIVVAPTGVAAINAGGVTIHSFFQLAPGLFLPGQTIGGREQKNKYSFSKHKINILRSLDLLVIDEVSMVRCDLLDAIDDVLRRYQNRNLPFGGVQLLLIGDLQQLAPVTSEDEWQLMRQHGYTTPYFFGSQALNQTNYTTIELTHVYRQSDPTFVNMLNQVRDNKIDAQTLQVLNSRYMPNFKPSDEEGYITLTTHNVQAHDINRMKLMMLPTKPMKYEAEIEGEFPELSYPTDSSLELKIGAQVMFCKNDSNKQFYNGKIGQVVKLDSERVWVRCAPDSLDPENPDEEKVIEVSAQEWTNSKYKTDEKTGEISEEIVGKFTQIPLKTAWAITIHKSQGLTFDRAIINAGRAFSPGQVYVALSRCRSLEGLVLSTPIPPGVITVDPMVVQYNQQVQDNQPTAEDLKNDRRKFVEDILCKVFDYDQLQIRLNYMVRLFDEHLHRQYPIKVSAAKGIRDEVEKHLTNVGRTFQQQIRSLTALADTYEENPQLQDRVRRGTLYYFDKTTDLMQDFIEDGLPEIDNKANKEQLEREFQLLESDYNLKVQLFTKFASHGFSLNNYWDAKAIASMTPEEKKEKERKKATKSKSEKVKKIAVSDNDDIKDQKLFNALRDWRSEKAIELKVPAYTIMHNVTLIALANNKPQDLKQLLAIPGIGKKVLGAFGAELLEIIRKQG